MAIVINLVVLVQLSQSHTIKPTIIVAESELDNDDDVVLQTDQDDYVAPEINPYKTCNFHFFVYFFEILIVGVVDFFIQRVCR